MRVGAVFPQIESGEDPAAIRRYAEAVEAMGFDHILAYDHVLGASTASRPDWSGPYNSNSIFHEVFVLFSYMAAVTRSVELVPAVLVLPQRQTALVAKQAAQVDLLSEGRLRLGVGVGWNEVEYAGLKENFNDRGARSEEQIALLRALWSATAISFNGRWHTIDDAGINPLPPRRSIPIWIGGYSEATLRRIGAMGDGWFPWRPPSDDMRAQIERMREYARAAGRDPDKIGLEPQLAAARVPEAEWASYVEAWRGLGATHLCINTMGAGLTSLDAHVELLGRVRQRLAGVTS